MRFESAGGGAGGKNRILFPLQFELTCKNNGNNLLSEECTNFDTSIADVGTISGGGTTSPEISIIKLSATPDAGNVVKETNADAGIAQKQWLST